MRASLRQRKPFVLCSPANRQGNCTPLCPMGTGLLCCLCKHRARRRIPGLSDRCGLSGTVCSCPYRTGGVGGGVGLGSAYTNAVIEVEDEATVGDDV